MKTTNAQLARGREAWQQERWQRIALGIRLAYNPFKPEVIRYWVDLGARLADEGVLDETRMLRRTLRVLLQVARDEALPAAWRRACLEHTARPLARLTSLARGCPCAEAQALHASIEAVHAAWGQDADPALPPAAADPAAGQGGA